MATRRSKIMVRPKIGISQNSLRKEQLNSKPVLTPLVNPPESRPQAPVQSQLEPLNQTLSPPSSISGKDISNTCEQHVASLKPQETQVASLKPQVASLEPQEPQEASLKPQEKPQEPQMAFLKPQVDSLKPASLKPQEPQEASLKPQEPQMAFLKPQVAFLKPQEPRVDSMKPKQLPLASMNPQVGSMKPQLGSLKFTEGTGGELPVAPVSIPTEEAARTPPPERHPSSNNSPAAQQTFTETNEVIRAIPPPINFAQDAMKQKTEGVTLTRRPILLHPPSLPTFVELTVEDELPESDIVNIINNIVSSHTEPPSQINSGDWWDNLQTVGSPAPSSPEDILTLGQVEDTFLPDRQERHRSISQNEEEEAEESDATYRPTTKKQCKRKATRRQLKPKKGVKPPEREKMTIADLIIWNPTENPIKECTGEKETIIGNIEDDAAIEDPDNSEHQPEEEEENVGPRLVVTDDGEIVVDERSLYLTRTRTLPPSSSDGSDKFRGGYSRKNTRSSWSKKETLQFYKLLSVVGTDFSLLSHLLPGKSRIQIINKYKLERKKNKELINKARNLQVFDLKELLTTDHWRSEEEEVEEPPIDI